MNDSDQPSPTTSPVDEPQPVRLKVMPLVKQTYATVFGNFGDMLKIVWVGMVLSVVAAFYQARTFLGALNAGRAQVEQNNYEFNVQVPSEGGDLFLGLVLIGITASIGVALMRYILVGQKPSFPGFGLGGRELRFFGYMIVYYILIVLAMMVPMALLAAVIFGVNMAFGSGGAMFEILPVVLFIAVVVFLAMVATRLAFVFPALASDREGGLIKRFRHAWHTAKGHTATMIAAILVASLPLFAVSIVMQYSWMTDIMTMMANGEGLSISFTWWMVGNQLMMWADIILLAVMFAHAYATVEALPQNAEENPSALDEA